MNSCIAILLVLGASPYQPAETTADSSRGNNSPNQIMTVTAAANLAASGRPVRVFPQQRLTYSQPLTIQRPLVIYQPDVQAHGGFRPTGGANQPRLLQHRNMQQPVVVYQTQPQYVAQPIRLLQATVPPMPYDQPVPAANSSSSMPQPITMSPNNAATTGHGGACGGSCGSTCGNSCGSCCGSSCNEFGSCLGKLADILGNKCQCGCECDDDKFDDWESTYDMPQHIPYQPAYHGYYYYRPYNYRQVLQHKQLLLGESTIAPYTSLVFEQVYAEFPNESYNPDPAKEAAEAPFIEPAPEKLPSLTDLLDGDMGQ